MHKLAPQAGGCADIERHVLVFFDEVRVTEEVQQVPLCSVLDIVSWFLGKTESKSVCGALGSEASICHDGGIVRESECVDVRGALDSQRFGENSSGDWAMQPVRTCAVEEPTGASECWICERLL